MNSNIWSRFFVLIIFSFLQLDAYTQSYVSGSFETSTIRYLEDGQTKAAVPEDKLGSNNYLKLDFQFHKLKGGLQYEAYLPVLQGYPTSLHGNGLVFKYASFQDSAFSVTVGDFYEQFGHGLILRSYEERALGLNTALEGVRVTYSFGDVAVIKGIVGRPRSFMEKAESTVKGLDFYLYIDRLLKLEQSSLNSEISIIDRYVPYTGQADINPNVRAYSINANWQFRAFSLTGEYAYKTADKSTYSADLNKDGSAFLVDFDYSKAGFSSSLTFRRLEYMQFGTTRDITGIGRDLNYLPALTKQYSYSLATLNPHNTMGNGEIGGQLDLHYRLKDWQWFGGEYGTKIGLNVASFYNLKGDVENGYRFFAKGDRLYYQDIGVDLERRLSETWFLRMLYSAQQYNPIVIGKEDTKYSSQIAVADITWKTTDRQSLRFEGQHLWSKDYQKNWVAGLVELSLSARSAVLIGDMFNYGQTGIHYYKVGCSYSLTRTRFAAQYGRNREGIICAGGVCLYMPAYTGLNLSIVSAF
ncbi:DUF6029 family protein [Sphingobacterium sp. LRF_L2]|uniref:DUF6029 family protein n=1 Tax=Sphingobacterium sp. LRF_L2 TaxID=3369421 RepID=UPI003F610C8A